MIDPPLWEMPPLRRGASRFVVLSWLGVFAFGSMSLAGIVWAIVAWCTN